MGMPSALVPWHRHAKRAGALARACQARRCLGTGMPSAPVPWHGHAKRAGALARACQARWCLGIGTLCADFALGGATLAFGKKKKNLLGIFSNFAEQCITLF
jgi:hypothetical protein